ncbi:flagellar biosynthesis repressor FlbT [Limimaricola sp.]|uniref:flagellar biosynthesis repressor FlbT n=1 Tax=Limimaricola sp. TaxID=2211665 RepID=UPI00405800D9
MPLCVSVRPGRRIVVNGCIIRAVGRRASLVIESRAQILHERDLVDADAPATPLNAARFLLLAAVTDPDRSAALAPAIRDHLSALNAPEAQQLAAAGDWHGALVALRPLISPAQKGAI